MAISTEELRDAGEAIRMASSLREAAAESRKREGAIRWIVVDAFDMRDETPVLELRARRVYLATTHGACVSITQQPADATALIVTEG